MTVLSFEDLSAVQKSVEVEIPAALISTEAQRVTSEFSRAARLPGFRPGKAPASVVRTRFAKEIEEEVVSRVLGQSFREVVRDKGLEPVGDPQLEEVSPFIEGAPMKFKARFEVKPQIELGEYRGLEIEEPKIEVTDTDIDAMIERLRGSMSHLRPVEGRGAQDGDVAMIEMTSVVEGIEPETRSGEITIGEESPLPELHEKLQGRRPEESVSFDRSFDENAQNEAWRGQTVHFDVTLKMLATRELPEVNDEFAQSVGGWESADQMRERIGADIRRHREAEALRFKRSQMGEQLLARHTFEVPETLVDDELGKSLNNYARYLVSQGVDLEKAEVDWRRIGEDFRPEAVKRVKRSLILEAIARKEGLGVSDVEVDAEIRRAANDQGRDFAEVKHHLKNDGGYEALRTSLAQDKALELVLRESRPKA